MNMLHVGPGPCVEAGGQRGHGDQNHDPERIVDVDHQNDVGHHGVGNAHGLLYSQKVLDAADPGGADSAELRGGMAQSVFEHQVGDHKADADGHGGGGESKQQLWPQLENALDVAVQAHQKDHGRHHVVHQSGFRGFHAVRHSPCAAGEKDHGDKVDNQNGGKDLVHLQGIFFCEP